MMGRTCPTAGVGALVHWRSSAADEYTLCGLAVRLWRHYAAPCAGEHVPFVPTRRISLPRPEFICATSVVAKP